MGSVDNTPGASVGAASWSGLSRREVLAELDRILESHQFRASKKCSRFLRHIVEAAANGRFDCLKERTLGVDVFDREPHYDTNQDLSSEAQPARSESGWRSIILRRETANFDLACHPDRMCLRLITSRQRD